MRVFLLGLTILISSITHAEVQHLVRYEYQQQISYGQVIGEQIQPLSGELFATLTATGKPIPLSGVKLMLPITPQKVFAVGMNFASHMSSPSNAPPPLFLKLPSALILSGEVVHLPADASNVHFEGELVLVIGKRAKNVTQAQAKDVIFGVMVGNDITERNWQGSDLQWMRAKASDGFGPLSAMIAIGVDYNNVVLTTKLNGKIVQRENTKFMIHKPAKVVSYLSQYFTLQPGDLIYMGTPGRTQAMRAGDEVAVMIENVGKVVNVIEH
ncbi:MAG: fumarylacetoacetate hydrolase family protein [Oceanospirillaceae bacterium]|nr:fumarylacetoacetate hydrolase family protein [Oceanospirillaceae bacterium]